MCWLVGYIQINFFFFKKLNVFELFFTKRFGRDVVVVVAGKTKQYIIIYLVYSHNMFIIHLATSVNDAQSPIGSNHGVNL